MKAYEYLNLLNETNLSISQWMDKCGEGANTCSIDMDELLPEGVPQKDFLRSIVQFRCGGMSCEDCLPFWLESEIQLEKICQ
jgi:hypothetical protein